MKNLIKARIAPLFGFTARAAVIVCCIALLALAGCNEILGGPGSESDPYPLTIGPWKNGSISLVLNPVWYSFSVTKGNTYAVYQDDLYVGDPATFKTADIMVSAKYPKGNYIFGSLAEGIDTYPKDGTFEEPAQAQIFEASQNGTVLLCVQRVKGLLLDSPYGSFGVKVSDISSSGTPVTFSGVSPNGSATTTTTTLTLNFSAPITDLSADDIILTGMLGINKGTLSGSGSSYTLQVNVTQSGTVSVSVLKEGYKISGNPKTAKINYNAGGSATGLYTGIIGFNGNITTSSPSLLNATTQAAFTSKIDALTLADNSALYYAVDNAITMLQTATLPNDLVNVSIVTFTDGFDNVSINRNKAYITLGVGAYRTAVNNKLKTTKIGNLNISAYSIGIKGGDVIAGGADAEARFKDEDLNALANPVTNAKLASDMNAVNQQFTDIASSLYSESVSCSIKLKIPGGIVTDKIRFTFDDGITDVSKVDDSTLYIEGVASYNVSTDSYSITNVVYHGMTGISGATVSGTEVSDGSVEYTFQVKSNLDKANVKLWKSEAPSFTGWDSESEFKGASDTVVTTEKKSAVIILVLDCSSSLDAGGANGFTAMKTAAKSFISTLVGAQ